MDVIKPKSRPRFRLIRRGLGLLSLALPGLGLAAPMGGQVVAGQASIGTTGSLTTVINQSSPTAVINWQQFNVGGQELVQFIQPSASAAILNRVVGGNPSEILGQLSANGRVFLINPQGLMFGVGSRVDVGGLMATTLDIKDSDFLAGRYLFASNGSTASVANQGRLSAADGGFVILAGDSSRNSSLIQARLGQVVMASGSAMTLAFNNDGLVSYAVNSAAVSDAAGVTNGGELLADGGFVLMTASVARNLVTAAVNNTGIVRAARIGEENGEIRILGAAGTVTLGGGTIEANTVQIESEEVTTSAPLSIKADGFGARGNNVNLVQASLTIGNGTAPFGTEEGLLTLLARTAPELLPGSSRPNASFVARHSLVLGDIDGTAQYLLLDAPDFAFGGTVDSAQSLFMHIIPGIDNADIAISDLSFARNVETLGLGSRNFNGNIRFVGRQSGGTATNYALLTGGSVVGSDNVRTDGRVVVLPRNTLDVPEYLDTAPNSDLVPVTSRDGPGRDAEGNEQTKDDSDDGVTQDDDQSKQQCNAV